jgi:hypothetical protein
VATGEAERRHARSQRVRPLCGSKGEPTAATLQRATPAVAAPSTAAGLPVWRSKASRRQRAATAVAPPATGQLAAVPKGVSVVPTTDIANCYIYA